MHAAAATDATTLFASGHHYRHRFDMAPTTGVQNEDAEMRNKSPPGSVLINENDSEDSDSDLSSSSDEDDIDSILKKTLIVPRAFYTRKLQSIPTVEEVRRRRTVKGIIEHCTTSLTDSNSPVHLLKAVGDAIQGTLLILLRPC